MSRWSWRLIGVPKQVRSWLEDRGSLTQRLRGQCAHFAVRDVRQYRASVLPDEVGLCVLNGNQAALMRDVWLCCGVKKRVFAHSVLPNASLQGDWRHLAQLGDRPLGTQLFTNYSVKRGQLQFQCVRAGHPLYALATQGMPHAPIRLWARRSLFMLGKNKILVTEVFMPAGMI